MIPNFLSLLLPFEFILCKNWNKPHFLSNYYLFCHKLSGLDKISFLYALVKNQVWKTENAFLVQKLKRKRKLKNLKIIHNFSCQKTTCTRQMGRPIFLVLFLNRNSIQKLWPIFFCLATFFSHLKWSLKKRNEKCQKYPNHLTKINWNW